MGEIPRSPADTKTASEGSGKMLDERKVPITIPTSLKFFIISWQKLSKLKISSIIIILNLKHKLGKVKKLIVHKLIDDRANSFGSFYKFNSGS